MTVVGVLLDAGSPEEIHHDVARVLAGTEPAVWELVVSPGMWREIAVAPRMGPGDGMGLELTWVGCSVVVDRRLADRAVTLRRREQ